MKALAKLSLLLFLCSMFAFSDAGTGSKASAQDVKDALEVHNKARKEVGVPALKWSNELAAYAQEWADYLAKKKCDLEHRPSVGKWKQLYGENIFWGSSSNYTIKDACEDWLEEKKDFKNKPLKGNSWTATGHYTQMIWKNTQRVGLGIAKCADGAVIVVANYDPAGNYLGEKAY